MQASAASRCAWSELKSCFSPSSVDLRVYMAQRTGTGSGMLLLPVQAKEGVSVPACAGDMECNGSERAIDTAVVLETVTNDLHLNVTVPVLPRECFADW